MRKLTTLVLCLTLAACATPGPPTQPNDREWNLLTADHQWIETLRKSQKAPPTGATRKQQIETVLDNHQKMQPTYVAFIDKVHEYHSRTGDPRAARLLSNEKILLGDEYMNVLSRYEKALDLYREALLLDATNTTASERIAAAEKKRYVDMGSFAAIKQGMKESEVRTRVGVPREDWMKQVVQNKRVYSVWIYPKSDGGASAIYFDNGVVYHTNWNAAAPPAK